MGVRNMKSIDRISIVDQVIQNLLDYIKEQKLESGDKMPTEKEVCTILGVGRSTAREAYRMLQAMNVVVAVQGKGVFVSEKKEQQNAALAWFQKNGRNMADYMEIRMAIEPMGARFAIQRATESQIAQLEKIQQKFKKALDEKNTVKLLAYDESFHSHIMECTGNQLLILIEENIMECFREYRTKAFALEETMGNALEPHQRILEAFKTGDAELGYRLMMEHLEISMNDIRKYSE